VRHYKATAFGGGNLLPPDKIKSLIAYPNEFSRLNFIMILQLLNDNEFLCRKHWNIGLNGRSRPARPAAGRFPPPGVIIAKPTGR
jgi:hypothetical protein